MCMMRRRADQLPMNDGNLLHGALATDTFAESVSAHWIVRSNPMGRMVYGYSRQRRQHLAPFKNKHILFYY